MYPRQNIYDRRQDIGSTTEVGLISRPSEDIYVVLNTWGDNGATATLTIFVNPLTMWMWTGGVVLVLGTLVCLWPDRKRRLPAAVPVRAQPVGAAAD